MAIDIVCRLPVKLANLPVILSNRDTEVVQRDARETRARPPRRPPEASPMPPASTNAPTPGRHPAADRRSGPARPAAVGQLHGHDRRVAQGFGQNHWHNDGPGPRSPRWTTTRQVGQLHWQPTLVVPCQVRGTCARKLTPSRRRCQAVGITAAQAVHERQRPGVGAIALDTRKVKPCQEAGT